MNFPEATNPRSGWPRRAALAGAAVLALAGAPASAHHGSVPCRGQAVPISKHTIAKAERASLCLLNLYRRANGLEPLVLHPVLADVARAHSEDMVERDYLSSTSPDGADPSDRAAAAGYRGKVGENTAASGAVKPTPHTLFNASRANPAQRRLMLSRDPKTGDPLTEPYLAAAVGLARGAPEVSAMGKRVGPRGATATQLFGTDPGGYTDNALDLAGGSPASTAACGRASKARAKARQAYKQAKAAKRRVLTKLEKARSDRRREKLADKLRKKRKFVAKTRSRLRQATEKRNAAC